jgi:hypothetical protein
MVEAQKDFAAPGLGALLLQPDCSAEAVAAFLAAPGGAALTERALPAGLVTYPGAAGKVVKKDDKVMPRRGLARAMGSNAELPAGEAAIVKTPYHCEPIIHLQNQPSTEYCSLHMRGWQGPEAPPWSDRNTGFKFKVADLAPAVTVGCTPLHMALHLGKPADVVEAVLVAGPGAAGMADGAGQLPLAVAIERGYGAEVAQQLLAAHPKGFDEGYDAMVWAGRGLEERLVAVFRAVDHAARKVTSMDTSAMDVLSVADWHAAGRPPHPCASDCYSTTTAQQFHTGCLLLTRWQQLVQQQRSAQRWILPAALDYCSCADYLATSGLCSCAVCLLRQRKYCTARFHPALDSFEGGHSSIAAATTAAALAASAAAECKMNAAGLPLKPRKPRKTAGTDPVQYAARLVAYESECVVVEAALEKRKLSKEADKNLSKRQKTEKKQAEKRATGDANVVEQTQSCAGFRVDGLEDGMHLSLSGVFEPVRTEAGEFHMLNDRPHFSTLGGGQLFYQLHEEPVLFGRWERAGVAPPGLGYYKLEEEPGQCPHHLWHINNYHPRYAPGETSNLKFLPNKHLPTLEGRWCLTDRKPSISVTEPSRFTHLRAMIEGFSLPGVGSPVSSFNARRERAGLPDKFSGIFSSANAAKLPPAELKALVAEYEHEVRSTIPDLRSRSAECPACSPDRPARNIGEASNDVTAWFPTTGALPVGEVVWQYKAGSTWVGEPHLGEGYLVGGDWVGRKLTMTKLSAAEVAAGRVHEMKDAESEGVTGILAPIALPDPKHMSYPLYVMGHVSPYGGVLGYNGDHPGRYTRRLCRDVRDWWAATAGGSGWLSTPQSDLPAARTAVTSLREQRSHCQKQASGYYKDKYDVWHMMNE